MLGAAGVNAEIDDSEAITMFSVLLALVPPPFVQLNAGVNVPDAVAVPVICPVDVLSVNPVGRPPPGFA